MSVCESSKNYQPTQCARCDSHGMFCVGVVRGGGIELEYRCMNHRPN